jgi:hypothetical protein
MPTITWLIVLYTAGALLMMLLTQVIFRNWKKACLAAWFLMGVNLFFGSFQDGLRGSFPHSFLNHYTILLPLLLILVSLVLYKILRHKGALSRLILFLNFLFFVLIITEFILLLPAGSGKVETAHRAAIPACDTCRKPDIYFIICDEYAGKRELKEVFGFDNGAFEESLAGKGFHVVDSSRSAYNATVYSMASIFNMHPIAGLAKNDVVNQRDMLLCRHIINDNILTRFLMDQGYHIHNLSLFDFGGKPKAIKNYFFPSKQALFTAPTLLNRLKKDLGFHLFTPQKVLDIKYHDLSNDQKIESLLAGAIAEKGPKFIYAHFTMPHFPYYFDKDGKPFTTDSLQGFEEVKRRYIGYLQYTNQKMLLWIDEIRNRSAEPPLIILASDHGFRQFDKPADARYYFMNLCAVLLPHGNYRYFYKGMSAINIFPAVINATFGQNLPFAKDTSIFLTEPPKAF